jgi:hypothetical protein
VSQEPEKKPKDDPVGMALLVIVGLIVAAVLVRFLGHLLSEGWSAASTEVPAGKIVFYIILGIAVFLLGPWLMDHGYRTLGKVVIFCVAGVVALTVIAAMPSCNNNTSNSGDLPYYRR